MHCGADIQWHNQLCVCVCVLRHVYRWWKLLALRSEIVIIWSIPKLCALAAGDGQCYWMKSRDKLSWWSLNRHTEVLCKHQQIFLILLANKQKKETYSTFLLLLRMLVFWKKFFWGLNGATRLLLSIVQSNCSVRWVAMFAVILWITSRKFLGFKWSHHHHNSW